ncbi:MAG: YjgN family protein [Paracoccaceae bacterium]
MKAIKFYGRAGEYFQIWLTNLFLTVITIGIYSAWAKVRRNLYFFNKTEIDEHKFGYHATGLQIFKGRLIAGIVIVLYAVLITYVPYTFLLVPVFFFLIPWIMNNSLKFSARMTSYRNLRFNWNGSYGRTFLIFFLAPSLSVLSLGLLHPWVKKIYFNYYAKGHSYGASGFETSASTKDFYIGAIRSGYLICLVAMIAIILIGLTIYWRSLADALYYGFDELVYILEDIRYTGTGYAGLFLTNAFLTLIPILVGTSLVYRILARNILLNSLSLSDSDKNLAVKFNSNLNPLIYFWIILSNTFITIITLGFMLPWAQIRLYKYLCSSTKTEISGDSNKFLDNQKSKMSAFGEEYSDMEGIDVGI